MSRKRKLIAVVRVTLQAPVHRIEFDQPVHTSPNTRLSRIYGEAWRVNYERQTTEKTGKTQERKGKVAVVALEINSMHEEDRFWT